MSGTKVTIKSGSGKPRIGSLKKAELAIDLDSMELWTAQTDGGDPQKIVGGDDGTGDAVESVNGKTGVVVLDHDDVGAAAADHEHEGIAENAAQIEQNKQDIADNKTQIDINTGDIAGNADQIAINKGNIAGNAAQIEINKGNIEGNADQIAINKGNIATNTGDIADTNDRIDKLALNDLTDVDAKTPNRNDYLVYNGTDWESEPPSLIDTELTYQGAVDMTAPAPASPSNGDLYINDTDGVVHASWGVIAGLAVNAGNVVGWADKTARWYLMGDISSGSVTDVKGGYLITVDDSVPSQPVVNFDSVEADKIYLKIEEQFWKAVTGGIA